MIKNLKMNRTLFYTLIIVILSGCSISQNKAKQLYLEELSNSPYDAIIVPGVPFYGEDWSRTMEARVKWSKFLYDKGITKNIIYSGSAVYTEFTESKIMGLYAEQLMIPSDHLFYDTRAEHSTENVYYSYQIAKEKGFDKIALATDPFQTKSLKRFIRKFDFPIKLIPIIFDSLGKIDVQGINIDPSSAKKKDFISIKERESFFKRLKGTFGQNIQWKEEDLKTKRLKKKYADRIEN